MNTVLLAVILIPIVEIYLFIKIGSQIGAFSTIFLVFFTAVVGVYYARYEGINTLRSGMMQIIKNQKYKKNNFIDGEFEDIEDDNDRKI